MKSNVKESVQSQSLDNTLRKPGRAALEHIPGPRASPVPALTTIKFLSDPLSASRRMYDDYGPIFKNRAVGGWRVGLLGPDANELVLFDRDKAFSSKGGWGSIFDRLFPRSLLLLERNEHRIHRRTLSAAFKPGPMAGYSDLMQARIGTELNTWNAEDTFRVYPAIKDLTLSTAASTLLGAPFGLEGERINKAFVDMIAASIAVVRIPLPGTAMAKGVRGYRLVSDYFQQEIPRRRGRSDQDIFTTLVNVRDDEGGRLSDQAIVDHINFLVFSAHDTQTSALTVLIYYLAKHPEWQQKLREELLSQPLDEIVTLADLGQMTLTEMAIKEGLRLNPPVPGIPRQAVKDVEFAGHTIPAGTILGLNTLFTHRMPEIWESPSEFDPLRFTPERSAGRHKYAFVPFGGGIHTCLGLHFTYLQAKIFLRHFLGRFRVELEQGYEPSFNLWLMSKPRDGLKVKLKAL